MRNASDTETDFRKHVFFSQMDWNQIEARSIDAPIITTTRDRKTRDQIEILNDYICQFHRQSNTFLEWCTHLAKMTVKEMISVLSAGTNGRGKCWKLCTALGTLKIRKKVIQHELQSDWLFLIGRANSDYASAL